ncbi:hypothetical protein ACFOHT_19080 [Massilia oculi]|uniref:hypothetical protein n=1 Tax=Massilia oculi TaxID=945844 RepID=UPI0013B4632B|nr:hypothetical protein [Massilia oculi]
MRFPNNVVTRLETWFRSRTAALARPGAPVAAAWIVPVLFGLVSVYLGQDENWDLRNYHWYNAHALLNGRIDLDMAPAQFQSYFNPLIDVPYYVLSTNLPGPLVGFLMGCVHGLNFILLLAIARVVIGDRADRARLPLLLAGAGVCGAGFLSQVGNTMGDNLTALLVLGALHVIMRGWDGLHKASVRAAGVLLASGLLMGLGTGLKLTNAPYAVALCLALLVAPASWPARIGFAFVQGCGVLAGMLASGGYWWLEMWERFGNPLFPQFNNIFKSPLAQQLGVIDNSHMPHNILEALFWPFVFMAQVARVSEIPLKIAVIPLLYAMGLLFVVSWLRGRLLAAAGPGSAASVLSTRACGLLLFGLIAYLLWVKLFGIYRYLVPLELLAPLMVWILAERMFSAARAARIGGWLLAATTLAVFPFVSWGHAGWASPNFSASVPPLASPADTIVFTAHGDPPMGWLATFFPHEVRVIALAGGFPESPAWLERVHAAVAERTGPHYVMLAAARSEKENSLQRKRALVDALGLTGDAAGCARLERLTRRGRFHVDVRLVDEPGRACTLDLQQRYVADLPEQDRARMQATRQTLAQYGLAVDDGACKTYLATAGTAPYPFRFCTVTVAR